MNVKGNHPLGEILATKLFSIETVPPIEQKRMVSRAIKSAIAWYENNKPMQNVTKPCTYCIGSSRIRKANFCERCGRNLSD